MARILVVDDEPSVLEVIKGLLEKDGHDVVTADSGRGGLDVLNEELPDLILMDVMMPGMDGWEAAKKIKKHRDTKDIPLAMLTVKSSAKDRAKSLGDIKADWHIAKPVTRERLLNTVDWLLKKQYR
jgi:CheY-like chemotaxis protein